MSERILLTGGAGFIGTNLAARLVDDGHDVVLFDNLRRNALRYSGLADHPNVTFVEGDILDELHITDVADGCDAIVHLAAIAGVPSVMNDPTTTMHVNFVGTRNVLEAAVAANVRRLIEFSSSEVVGKRAAGVNENEVRIEPRGDMRWTYAVSKLAGEYLAHAYYGQFELPVVSIRLFNVYGPGQVGEGAVHTFIEQALSGGRITIHNDGSAVRTWCYVDDVVEALVLCLASDEAVGEVLNIGHPRSVITARALAETVLQLVGSDSWVEYEPLGYEDVDIRIPSIDKARALIGWEPKVELVDGLERTIAWYRANGLGRVAS